MGLGIPPIWITSPLESTLLSSRFLVCGWASYYHIALFIFGGGLVRSTHSDTMSQLAMDADADVCQKALLRRKTPLGRSAFKSTESENEEHFAHDSP